MDKCSEIVGEVKEWAKTQWSASWPFFVVFFMVLGAFIAYQVLEKPSPQMMIPGWVIWIFWIAALFSAIGFMRIFTGEATEQEARWAIGYCYWVTVAVLLFSISIFFIPADRQQSSKWPEFTGPVGIVLGCSDFPPPVPIVDGEAQNARVGRQTWVPGEIACGNNTSQWLLNLGGKVTVCTADNSVLHSKVDTALNAVLDAADKVRIAGADAALVKRAAADEAKRQAPLLLKPHEPSVSVAAAEKALRAVDEAATLAANAKDPAANAASVAKAVKQTTTEKIAAMGPGNDRIVSISRAQAALREVQAMSGDGTPEQIVNKAKDRANRVLTELGEECADTKVTGGLVVPLYFLIVSLIGALISLTRRVPEYQRRLSPNALEPITPAEAREYLVFQLMQFLTAPLLAVAAYYIFRPDARAGTIVVAFAAGFSSEAVLLLIRELITKISPALPPKTPLLVAPEKIDFGACPVGKPSAPKNATLVNRSSLPVKILSITVSEPFRISKPDAAKDFPLTLASGRSVEIEAIFEPKKAGEYSAKVGISNDVSAGPELVVTGIGVDPLAPPPPPPPGGGGGLPPPPTK